MKTKKFKTLQELFRSSKRWTQHRLAKNQNGCGTDPRAEDAVCWCLIGGARKVYGNNPRRYTAVTRKISQYLLTNRGRSTIGFNDHPRTTFKDIRELVKKLKV